MSDCSYGGAYEYEHQLTGAEDVPLCTGNPSAVIPGGWSCRPRSNDDRKHACYSRTALCSEHSPQHRTHAPSHIALAGSQLTEEQYSRLPDAEQKKQKRLIRNRLSAQMHRLRQRAHIDAMEVGVAGLLPWLRLPRRLYACRASNREASVSPRTLRPLVSGIVLAPCCRPRSRSSLW